MSVSDCSGIAADFTLEGISACGTKFISLHDMSLSGSWI